MRFLMPILFACILLLKVSLQTTCSQVPLKDLKNQSTNLAELANGEELVVISFWATWCKPCINELNAISEQLEDWHNEADFVFIAVSIDDARSTAKVKSMVNGSGWDFQVALDVNHDLKRHFDVNNIPFTLILKNMEIVHRHAGYLPGDEHILWKKILQLNE